MRTWSYLSNFMTTEEIKTIPFVLTVLEGVKPGKELVILAGVHGNETCGISALGELLPSLEIESGRLTIALGNPRAIEQNVRFTETNLNRMFQKDSCMTLTERASYEYARSRELMPLLAQADALLDIHSSATKDTVPFVVCEPNSFVIAQSLPVSLVSYNWSRFEPGGTDVFVNESGGMGLCIECGYHEEPEAIERAKLAIIKFLQINDSIFESPHDNTNQKQRLMKVISLHKTVANFSPAHYFKDFQEVVQGELIGNDGSKEVYAEDDGVVIFVRERRNSNEEAFLFAKEDE